MSFVVDSLIEIRNDNPDLRGYRVIGNNKRYILYYDKDSLREVYLMNGFNDSNYFISCRTDMKTISYYHIKQNKIERYENNILNRTYFCINEREIVSHNDDYSKRIYTTTYRTIDNTLKLYRDVKLFLNEFNKLNIQHCIPSYIK